MGYRLGNLEESVLLIVMLIHDEAYGVSIKDHYVQHTQHQLSLSAIHTVLRRLEDKGMIESTLGGATAERGGRRKRLYKVTPYGYKTAESIQMDRSNLWKLIPRINF